MTTCVRSHLCNSIAFIFTIYSHLYFLYFDSAKENNNHTHRYFMNSLWNYLFTVFAILFLCSCNSSGQKTGAEEKSFDSCTIAVKDENTKLAEEMVSPGYTGELKNYW